MPLYVFARFHARDHAEEKLRRLLADQIAYVRNEPGCLAMDAFGSTRDARLFFIHSVWADEAAFNVHADIDHTGRFLEQVQTLIDHPLDVSRTLSLSQAP
ncbi:MAG TPA: putative quinol monooxygenase [Rhizomicrobium sp.]|nr:putative quinol monooxygenase [Rhizomicrobium sp.]